MGCRRIHSLVLKLLVISSFFGVLVTANNLYAACCIGGEPLGSLCTSCGAGYTCNQLTLTCKKSGSIIICPDADGDGFASSTCGGTDCNDTNASINPNRAETCNGIDDNCDKQTDNGVVVPSDGNACTDDICKDGKTYPAASSSTVCHAAAGDCDNVEYCTGSSTVCPADTFKSSATTCRASAGTCDTAEKCTGTSATCPTDAKQPSSVVCRASAGDCDIAESCTGTASSCPTNKYLPATTTCRAAAGVCDKAETCTGTAASCPSDAKLANGAVCSDSNACTSGESCLSGSCSGGSFVNCEDNNECTNDSCEANAGCKHVNNSYSKSCYTGAAGTGGVGACRAGTTTCSGGVFGACVGEVTPSVETCDGIDNDCDGQTDEGLGFKTCGAGECANSVPACVNGQMQTCTPKVASAEVCDNKDNNCDGVVDDNADVLDIAGDQCHYKQCQSGGSLVLKSKTNGITCNDGNGCSLGDSCQGGICTGGTKADCSASADPCNDATCTSLGDTTYQCGKSPKTASCNADNNECTVGDACQSGVCAAGAQKVCSPSDKCHVIGECIAEIGICPKETVKNCNDGDKCTDDSCGATSGCKHTPVAEQTKPMGIGECQYTQTRHCSNNQWSDWVGSPPDKVFQQVCGDSTCGGTQTRKCSAEGVLDGWGICGNFAGASVSCNDGDACTGNDVCGGGSCNGGGAITCDDGNACTTNSCDPASGCKYGDDTTNACGWCGDISPDDIDKDNIPDVCDDCVDADGDGICGDVDNCPLVSNLTQDDLDKDGIGDACDEPDCGNAYLESGEACDDGNDDNLDLCRNDCSQPNCGDGIVDKITGEKCEAGVTALGAHQYCDKCLVQTEKYCGDGNIDKPNAGGVDEDCDGLNLGGATCESLKHKGGGDVSCGADCLFVADCSDSLCGDGVRDDGEECDGVAGITDPIHQKCESCNIVDIPPACGNGVVDGTEECDGGTDCRATCMLVKCGDGIQDAGEACDKGTASDTGECLSTCQIAECGDGFIRNGVEECDNGILNSDKLPDACRTYCIMAHCSDSVVDSNEACDDGKFNGDDGKCNSSCTGQKKYCGDGVKDAPNGNGIYEQCDGGDGVVEGKVCDEFCMSKDCADGDVAVCSTGLEGICSVGQKICVAGEWSECSQSAQAVVEVCDNGQDDDCDGLTDGADSNCGECAAGIVQACNITNAFGTCAGAKVCGADYKFGECQGMAPAVESCNAKDDDCDNLVDEDLERACSSVCGVGVETCSSGEWIGCSAPQPESEKCDYKDNDCDGEVDEGVKNACGVCGDVPAEVCDDGKDNNCDGAIDEGCVPAEKAVDGRQEETAKPVCTSKIFDCSKTRAMKLPSDTADIKVLDDGKLIVVIDSKGQMAAVEMKQLGEGAPKASIEKKEFKVECEDGKETLIGMKKGADVSGDFVFEGDLEGCSVKSSEKNSVTVNVGEKDFVIDITKAGETFGSEFNKSIGSGNFGVGETNILAGGSDAIKIGTVDDAGNITALPEEDERLVGCSEADKVCNNDNLHYIDPRLFQSVVLKPFGGADLMAMFTEEKSGEKYTFFYYNINEGPIVDAKQGESLGKFVAVGFDYTNDDLFYAWSCKDSAGKECDALLSTLEGDTVSVIAPAEGGSASGGSEWPLTLTVTATDPGGLSASKSIQAMKSGEMKAVIEAPSAPEAPPAESVKLFADTASMFGGGCGGFFSVGGRTEADSAQSVIIVVLLALSISVVILWRIREN